MSILSRKYPFPISSHWLRDCIMYCIIVFLILYLLQPFGFSMYQGNKLLVSLLFGFVTFCSCLVFGLAERPLHKNITPWRIWHESLSILCLIVFGSIFIPNHTRFVTTVPILDTYYRCVCNYLFCKPKLLPLPAQPTRSPSRQNNRSADRHNYHHTRYKR